MHVTVTAVVAIPRLRPLVVQKEDILVHAVDVWIFTNCLVINKIIVDRRRYERRYISPHTVLHPQHHRLHTTGNQPFEERNVQVEILSQVVRVD